jgi:hypothetical protein
MAFQLQDMQKTRSSVQGQNAAGNVAPIYGQVAFVSSDPAILTVTPIDSVSCYVESTGVLGSASVTASAFADAGLTKPITGKVDITVIPGEAVALLLTLATPEPR